MSDRAASSLLDEFLISITSFYCPFVDELELLVPSTGQVFIFTMQVI